MRYVCIGGVFAGAALMFFNIVFYYRSLVQLRQEAYAKKAFARKSYALCMLLMIFFLLGYLLMGSIFLLQIECSPNNLLITLIFFFGAVFVQVVLQVQTQMNQSINDKTDEIIKTLVNAMEAKDTYTRGHSVHVANLVDLFYKNLPGQTQNQLNYSQLMDAAILHDIGKIGISDNVLNKPGLLDEAEMSLIRTHPRMGKDILDQTSFAGIGNIILMHHERIDNNGYYRIPSKQVPTESRIIAIADTFSAIYTDRVYRPRKSYAQAVEILREASGTQLDAELVSVFLSIPEKQIHECSSGLYSMEQPGAPARPWKQTQFPAHHT